MEQQAEIEKEKQHDIKEFMEANQNTRMTLMEQQAEIEKEKQHLLGEKAKQVAEKEKLTKRLEFVSQYKDSGGFVGGATDECIKKSSEQLDAIKHRFEQQKQPPKDFVKAKEE